METFLVASLSGGYHKTVEPLLIESLTQVSYSKPFYSLFHSEAVVIMEIKLRQL